ncbi:MAG: hypothetical protein IT384_00145 [Deltaproteobacteria bacterium]|nr:hypothetical protein [Deltaproteobacteria bacterium]
MRAAWVLGAWAASVALSSPARAQASPPPAKGKLLVLEPRATGIDGRLTLAVTSALATAAGPLTAHPVITVLDVQDVLAHEESRILTTCDDEERCRETLEKLSGVELMIATTIGPVGKSMTITLALIDSATAVARARASAVVENAEALPDAATTLVGQLFREGHAGAAPAFHWGDKPAAIAVFDLVASGVARETATSLTQILTVEVKQVPGTKVIARDDIRAVLDLETQKELLGCGDSNSCLAEIGGALGVDYLVAGHVGRIAETHVVALRLIDPNTLEVRSRVTESFVGPEDQLVGALRFAVRKLFGLDATKPGELALSAGEGTGAVFIDGLPAGDVSQPLRGLPPGRHNLRIVDPDYLPWKGDVYVQPGRTDLSVVLEDRPTRWYQSWIFWTSVVGAAAIAGGTAIGLSVAGATAGTPTHAFGFEASLPQR